MKARDIIRAALARPVAFNPALARIAGSVTAGLFLSQAIYWSERATNPDGWFYKTREEWEDETCLGRHEQDTARRKLVGLGLMEEQRRGNGIAPSVMHFRVDLDAVLQGISKLPESGNLKSRNPAIKTAGNQPIKTPQSGNSLFIAETTAETTAEKKPGNAASASPAKPGNGQDKKHEPKPQDPRFPDICESIRKCWPKDCKCEITAADAGAINRMLARAHAWSIEELGICIAFRFWSDNVNVTESVKAWIGAVTDYQSGPQDKYGNEKLTHSRGEMREQALAFLYGKPIQPDLKAAEPRPSLPDGLQPIGVAIWAEFMARLRKKISPHSYETWLKPTRGAGMKDGTLYVIVPTDEFAHIAEKFDEFFAELPESVKRVFLIEASQHKALARLAIRHAVETQTAPGAQEIRDSP